MEHTTGIIGFANYRIQCIIGIEIAEREKEQEIWVDLEVEGVISKALLTDQLHDTVDYMSLAEVCKTMACNGRYHLIEKYAADVIAHIIDQYDVQSARIRVKKTQALKYADYTFVELKQNKRI